MFFAEIANHAGHWRPATFRDMPTERKGRLYSFASQGPRIRNIRPVPYDMRECGLDELQQELGGE